MRDGTPSKASLPSAINDAPRGYSALLRARCPAATLSLVERAAKREDISHSEYIRRSVIDRLKVDGIDPAQLAGAA